MVEERPWGTWEKLAEGNGFWVKRIVVEPGQRLSLQKHAHRSERWICVAGRGEALVRDFPKTLKNGNKLLLLPGVVVDVWVGAEHRMTNTGTERLEVIEVAFGKTLTEEDIVRLEDDYARHEDNE